MTTAHFIMKHPRIYILTKQQTKANFALPSDDYVLKQCQEKIRKTSQIKRL